MQGPLAGIHVLDLSAVFPFPLAAMYLGDLGADVIKIEHPRLADPARRMGTQNAAGSGSAYLAANRNKRSISLNLKKPAGLKILFQLLEKSDVLVESFLPGTTSKLGIDYDSIQERFPRLVYCHGSTAGYSADNPAVKASHEGNVSALMGLTGITGTKEIPAIPGFQVSDIAGGTHVALISILAALVERAASGRGQFVDVSMMRGAFAMLSLVAAEHWAGGKSKRAEMDLSGGLPGYAIYRTSDNEHVFLGVLEDSLLDRFLAKINRPELATLRAEPERFRNELDIVFRTRTRDEWCSLFQDEGFLSPVNSLPEAISLGHRLMPEMIVAPPGKSAGDEALQRSIGAPFRFSRTPVSYRLTAPACGEHTELVLGELGMTSSEIAELRKGGVI